MKRVMGGCAVVVRRDHTGAGLKGRNSTVAPAESGVRSATTMPWIWCSGRTWRIRSESLIFQDVSSALICALSERWVCTTPLGSDVVPEV